MTDRPIIFSAPMVRALLEGRKIMTRRLAWRLVVTTPESPRSWALGVHCSNGYTLLPSPWQKVRPGDRLWVRENFWQYGRWNGCKKAGKVSYSFEPLQLKSIPNWFFAAGNPESFDPRGRHGQAAPGWHLRPSIFLPRDLSRLTLEVTATKIERLQEMTEADAIAEGVQKIDEKTWAVPGTGCESFNGGAIAAFSALWASLHGLASWHENPEVVALTSLVVEANVDELSPPARTHVGAIAQA